MPFARMNPSVRFAAAVVGAGICVAATDCSSTDDAQYVHVYAQGIPGSAPTIQPFDLNVSVFAQGRAVSSLFATPSPLHPATAPATGPFSDFLVDVGSVPAEGVDLRLLTQGVADSVEWGADAHLTSAQSGQPLVITLARGEIKPLADEVFSLLDGNMQNATLFGGAGLALAWAAPDGSVREIAIDPDRPVGRARTVCDSCKGTQALRIASRPISPFGSDLYAISWTDDSGHLKLKTTTRTDTENAVIDVPPVGAATASGLEVACFRKGAKADVVVAHLESGDTVVLSFHDLAGALIGTPITMPTDAGKKTIAGVVANADDSFVVGVRGATSWLYRYGIDGASISSAPVAGDLRALGLTTDGNRLLVATSGVATTDTAPLTLATYSPTTLTSVGDIDTLTTHAFAPGATLSGISLSPCAIGWAERRADGTGAVDVRVQRIDDDGKPSDSPSFGNVAWTGTWFAPTLACASQTRVFVTFFDQATSQTGNLYLRRLP